MHVNPPLWLPVVCRLIGTQRALIATRTAADWSGTGGAIATAQAGTMGKLTWLGQNRAPGGTGGRPPASNQHETPRPHRASPGPARGSGGRCRGRGHRVRHRAARRPRLRSRARSPFCSRTARRRVPWHGQGPAPRRGAAALDLALPPRRGNPPRGGDGVPGPAARTAALRRAGADPVSDGRHRSQPCGSRDRLAARLPAVLLGQGRSTRSLRAHLGMLERRPASGPGPPLRGGHHVAAGPGPGPGGPPRSAKPKLRRAERAF
jgi:hypothetical protein